MAPDLPGGTPKARTTLPLIPGSQQDGVSLTSLLVLRTEGWDPGARILRGAPTERLCAWGSWMDCGRSRGCCLAGRGGLGVGLSVIKNLSWEELGWVRAEHDCCLRLTW